MCCFISDKTATYFNDNYKLERTPIPVPLANEIWFASPQQAFAIPTTNSTREIIILFSPPSVLMSLLAPLQPSALPPLRSGRSATGWGCFSSENPAALAPTASVPATAIVGIGGLGVLGV